MIRGWFPRKCPCCGAWQYGVLKRRLNTAYCNEDSNWQVSCERCYEKSIDYYNEMWAEYNAGRL